MERDSALNRVLMAVLFLALAAQCFYSAWTNGQTIDETYYNGSGYPMVRYNNYEFLGEHPPLSIQLGALPLLLLQPNFPMQNFIRLPGSTSVDISKTGALFLYKMGNDPQLILFLERIPIVLLTMLLGFGIWLLGSQFWGRWGGLLSLTLFSFSPNMIAHGSLYTTDMGLAVFYFFAILALKRFFDKPSERRVVLLGIACGLTFMSKISGLILIPVVASLFLIYYFLEAKQAPVPIFSRSFDKWILGISLFLIANAVGEKQAMVLFGPCCLFAFYLCLRNIETIRKSRLLRIVLKGAVLGGAVLCLVYSVRLKKKYGVSLSSLLTIGNFTMLGIAVWFARLAEGDGRVRLLKYFLAIWVFAALVIVLGYTDLFFKFYRFIGFGNFLKPFGIVMNHSRGGHGICVEGSFVTCNWRYFPGVIAVKTPLLTLSLSGIGALMLLTSRRSILIKALIFIPLAFFLGAAMANKINIGLRHILSVYPFFFLLGGLPGAAIANMKPGIFKKAFATLLLLLVLLFAVRSIRTAPDHLAFFNELVGGPVQGASLVADSNLNWGQDNKRLAEFVVKKKIPSITIASEAENADIYEYYKIPWKRLEEGALIHPTPGFYALSVGYYARQQNDPKSWFKGKQPRYQVGKTFYVFEVFPLNSFIDEQA
jgi:hypothetical protein